MSLQTCGKLTWTICINQLFRLYLSTGNTTKGSTFRYYNVVNTSNFNMKFLYGIQTLLTRTVEYEALHVGNLLSDKPIAVDKTHRSYACGCTLVDHRVFRFLDIVHRKLCGCGSHILFDSIIHVRCNIHVIHNVVEYKYQYTTAYTNIIQTTLTCNIFCMYIQLVYISTTKLLIVIILLY